VRLQHTTETDAGQVEPRYDAETLRKVTSLAQRLQISQQETFTAQEMEDIGAEVGVERSFIRRALAHLTHEEDQTAQQEAQSSTPVPRGHRWHRSWTRHWRLTPSQRVKIIVDW